MHPYNPNEDLILKPVRKVGMADKFLWAVLGGILLLGIGLDIRQMVMGLGVTGLNRPVYWGIYITNFVFFIGISHAGTLISAILRVSNARWRTPVTRMAEFVTVDPHAGPERVLGLGQFEKGPQHRVRVR